MTDFIDKPEEQPDEFIGPAETTPSVSPALSDQLVAYYSTALNKDRDSVALDMESGSFPILRNEASQKADANTSQRASIFVENLLTEKPEDAQEKLNTLREGLVFGNYIAPDVAALLNENSDMSAFEKRVIERAFAAQRIIEEKREQSSEGIISGIGYWLDSGFSDLVHGPLGAASELTGVGGETLEGAGQLIGLAQEAAELLQQDITPEDFEQQFKDILDRVADAGLFSEENPFYLESFLQMVREGGVGFESNLARVFQVADIAALGVTSLAGNTGSLSRSMSRVAAREQAKDIVVELGEAGVDNGVLTEGTSVKALQVADPDREYYSAPELTAMRELEANNSALDAVKKYDWGSFVDPDIFEAKKAEWLVKIQEASKGYKRHEMNYDIRVGTSGNIIGTAVLGNRSGSPYKTLNAAQKFADRIGGEVLEQITEGKTQFVVRKEWDIPTQGFTDTTDLKEVASGFLSGIMSTTARTTVKLDAMLKRGEAQAVKAMRDLGKDYKKALKGVSKSEINNVDELFRQLRDDPLENWRREALTTPEFSKKYLQMFGAEPSSNVVKYFESARDISDVDYFLNADQMLKEAINNKETMVRLDGQYYRAKVVTPDADEAVYNMDGKSLHLMSDLDENTIVYEIKDFAYEPEGVGKVRYVVGDLTTRRMYHTDVMPYNVGGHRKYTDPYNFYIKQDGREVKLAGGATFDAKPSTFMTVRTEKEAKLAVDQFNNIVEAIQNNLPKSKVNEVIARNNNWNTSIEDIADFQSFVDEFNLAIDRKINYAGDNEPLVGQSFAGNTTIGSSFRNGLAVSKARGTRPLLGYGGEELDTLAPTKAIERGFAQSLARKGDQRYLFNAINGWIKAARKEGAILNDNDLIGLAPKVAMDRAELSKQTEVGKALFRERETIRYRLSNTTAQVAAEKSFLTAMADFAYKKGWNKTGKGFDKLSMKDPVGFMRAMAFHAKLGLFAVDQVYVQASQLINVAGIVSANIGPQGAVRSMLAVAPLRLALVEEIPQAALTRIAKLQSPFTGISPDDFIQLRDWVKHTGRNVVDKTVVEENNAVGSIVGNQILDYGQVFFREGELIARLGAAAANLLERRAKYPNEDIFDTRVVDKMIHRQDILTASMTSASAAPWQRSLLALPLQFTTYHVRMAEQLFTEGLLTKGEKVSLGLTHLFAYGTAAVPVAGYLQDRMGYEGAVDPSTGLYDVVRYGALDATLSALSGEETALSSRLAVGEGLFDLFMKTGEESLLEIAIGPSGSIGLEFAKATNSMIKNVFTGQFEYLSYDWNRFARNVTAYDRAYSLWMAQRYGVYVSRKSEDVLLDDMSSVEGVLKGLGIPLEEQELMWTTVGNMMFDKKMLDKSIKEIQRLDNIASRLINEGDTEGASKVMEDIGAMIQVHTPAEQDKIMFRLRQTLTIHENTIRMLIKKGHPEIANKLQEYFD